MPDGYLISVGVKADFSELKAEQKAAQQAVRTATDNMAVAYSELGKAAEGGSAQAIEALKIYEAELSEATSRLDSVTSSVGALAAAEAEEGGTLRSTISARMAANTELRILEGNLQGSNRAAGAFLSTLPGIGPAMQAAFPVFGALALVGVLVEMGKSAYNLYEKFISLDAISDKLDADFKKMAQGDVINVHSIETATERLGKANESATTLRESAQALHEISLKDLIGDLAQGNLAAAGNAVGGLVAAHSVGESGAQNVKNSIALSKEKLELDHQIRTAEIDAAHAGDGALDGQKKINAELSKRLALDKEEERYTRERDLQMGNAAPGDAGGAMRGAKDAEARGEAAAATANEEKKYKSEAISEMLAEDTRAQQESKQINEAMQESWLAMVHAEEEAEKQKRRSEEDAATEWKKEQEEKTRILKEQMAEATSPVDQQASKVKEQGQAKDISPSQEAAQLTALVAQKVSIQDGYYQQLEALYAKDSVEWQKIEDERLAALRKDSDDQLKIQDNLSKETSKSMTSALNVIGRQWMSVQDRMLKGQLSIGRGMQQMSSSMLLDMVHGYEKMIAQIIRMDMMKLASTNATNIQTVASNAAAAQSSMAVTRTNGLEEVFIHAKVAAAKSFDWASGWGGPIAGAIAAALAFTGVMAVGAFENGGVVGGSIGSAVPIIAHAGERVLTTGQTANFERMVNGGGKSGAGSTNHFGGNTFNGVADSKTFSKMLNKHERSVVKATKKAMRNGRS